MKGITIKMMVIVGQPSIESAAMCSTAKVALDLRSFCQHGDGDWWVY